MEVLPGKPQLRWWMKGGKGPLAAESAGSGSTNEQIRISHFLFAVSFSFGKCKSHAMMIWEKIMIEV